MICTPEEFLMDLLGLTLQLSEVQPDNSTFLQFSASTGDKKKLPQINNQLLKVVYSQEKNLLMCVEQ